MQGFLENCFAVFYVKILKQNLLITIRTLINISFSNIYTKYSCSLALCCISIYNYRDVLKNKRREKYIQYITKTV